MATHHHHHHHHHVSPVVVILFFSVTTIMPAIECRPPSLNDLMAGKATINYTQPVRPTSSSGGQFRTCVLEWSTRGIGAPASSAIAATLANVSAHKRSVDWHRQPQRRPQPTQDLAGNLLDAAALEGPFDYDLQGEDNGVGDRPPSLSESLDKSKDPCTSFYDYVCAGYENVTRFDSDQISVSRAKEMEERNMHLMLEAISDIGRNEQSLPHYMRLFVSYFSRCTDMEQRNAVRSMPILFLLKLARERVMDVTDFAIVFSPLALFYSINVLPSPTNSNVSIIEVSPANTIIEAEYLMNLSQHPAQHEAAVAYMSEIYDIVSRDDPLGFYFPRNQAERQRRIESMFAIESVIGRTLVELRRSTDIANEPAPYYALYEVAKTHDWERLFRQLIPADVWSALWAQGRQPEVIVERPDLTAALDADLQKILFTNPRAVTDYMDWKLAISMADSLGQPFLEARERFARVMMGTSKLPSLPKMCLANTAKIFPDISSNVYVKKAINISEMDNVRQLIDNVRAALIEQLKNSSWLDEETRGKAIHKAQVMTSVVGFESRALNETYLAHKYFSLRFKPQWFVGDLDVHVSRWMRDRQFRELHPNHVNERTMQETNAAEVNAYYEPQFNQLAIMAGILQPPYYGAGYPESMNYGSIGSIIGHEVSHGFDNSGSMFDAQGNVADWWTNATSQEYHNRTQCFVDEYNAIHFEQLNMNVNGIMTLGENIADNAGLRASKSAFNKNKASFSRNSLPYQMLSDFTDEQLFYVGFAYSMCTKLRPESARDQILVDAHAPNKARVDGSLSNDADFARAFGCAAGTRMNPEKKCTLW